MENLYVFQKKLLQIFVEYNLSESSDMYSIKSTVLQRKSRLSFFLFLFLMQNHERDEDD